MINVFVGVIDLGGLGFVAPAAATRAAEPIASYLAKLDTAGREAGAAIEARAEKLKEKIATLRAQMQALKAMDLQVDRPCSPAGHRCGTLCCNAIRTQDTAA
ncbi:hypothetical protein [Phenylobacterium sp.]|uniref:hypothetical protein n=1 Tax=Phenylobacterium sp. TaxID=1871053 RepID=UPI002733E2AC|nr:hypothetical protein [Phenylobacterium sp.]MDP3659322.1 hypothetical protein [Phenylobacterium sp.]